MVKTVCYTQFVKKEAEMGSGIVHNWREGNRATRKPPLA